MGAQRLMVQLREFGLALLQFKLILARFRLPWGLQAIPAILLFIGMIFLPESPRWLARKNKWDKCKEILTLVHGKGDPNSPWVTKEYKEIIAYCEFEKENADVTYWELLRPWNINRVQIGVFTQIWSQLTGSKVSSP